MAYCAIFGKSRIIVRTLEMRGLEKAQRGEATYPRSHSQRGQVKPERVTYSLVTAVTFWSHTVARCLSDLGFTTILQGRYH